MPILRIRALGLGLIATTKKKKRRGRKVHIPESEADVVRSLGRGEKGVGPEVMIDEAVVEADVVEVVAEKEEAVVVVQEAVVEEDEVIVMVAKAEDIIKVFWCPIVLKLLLS